MNNARSDADRHDEARLPLAGRVVVVTRDEGPSGPLGSALRVAGAVVLHWPTVRIAEPEDPAPFDAALRALSTYDWIVFTSARAAEAVALRADHPPMLRVAAVGASTAQALQDAAWPVHLMPEEFSAEALLRELEREELGGARVLFPASSLARPALADGLQARGARVDTVVAYRTVPAQLEPGAQDRLRALIETRVRSASGARRPERGRAIEAVTFASPSAVHGFATGFSGSILQRMSECIVLAAIGETTARALIESGCGSVVLAEESTFSGLCRAVAAGIENRESVR